MFVNPFYFLCAMIPFMFAQAVSLSPDNNTAAHGEATLSVKVQPVFLRANRLSVSFILVSMSLTLKSVCLSPRPTPSLNHTHF